MRASAVLVVVLSLLLVPASVDAAKPAPKPSWASAEIKLVVGRAIMGIDTASFRPDDVLTQGELAAAVAALTLKPPVAVAKPNEPVTMAALDSKLVRALGLADAAAAFASGARAAGLKPPSWFGTEAVARLLGLRKNHPAAQDDLERLPTEPASRAEAAYSLARIARFAGREIESARAAAATFLLPSLTAWQKRVLGTAFGFVGYPYVWGGESETTDSPFGPQVRGGFDCSGFVWRIYKLQPYPTSGALVATLRGRTTFEMSAEAPNAARVTLAKLAPADLVFFGAKGPQSKPGEVDHMGIYVGGGWIVHASSAGVALAQMTGWYAQRFAWGRRPLGEAGLAPAVATAAKP